MWLIRVFILALVFTSIGLGVMFYPKLQPLAEGYYAYYRAEYLFKSGEYAQARDYYEKALNGYPNQAQVLVKLGDTCKQLELPDEAKAFYDKAAVSGSGIELSHQTVARQETGLDTDDGNAAAEDMGALEAETLNKGFKAEVGNHFMQQMEASQTIADNPSQESFIDKLLKNKKDKDKARYQLGETLFSQGQYDKAIEVYCDLVLKYPESPETLYSLAVTFAKVRDYAVAADYMTKAAEYAESQHLHYAPDWARLAIKLERARQVGPHETSQATQVCLSKLEAAETEGQGKK